MKILAATDFSTRSQRALRRAGQLAQAEAADLAIIHVVDDDQPQGLVEMEARESERMLAELISAVSELRDVRCHPMVVMGDPFDAIVRTAAAQAADLAGGILLPYRGSSAPWSRVGTLSPARGIWRVWLLASAFPESDP
ncbi:universal stress protein [Bradyrhizobium sp. 157]|uniref:universal stress protein n=1 Tax=Bradyrhizobium sp. 157 TaxID=2782631 RepID=UPI001FFA29EB|nr:universal stress protein [Bradyrhizobium sp. 157]MCK1638922.1 universal stress protein [Bradyrhizobium sp. 157]